MARFYVPSILLLFVLFSSTTVFAQRKAADIQTLPPLHWQSAESERAALWVIITDTLTYQNNKTAFETHRDRLDYNLLIIADTMSLSAYCELVNATLNEENIQLRKVYLLGIVPPENITTYSSVDHDIYAAVRWEDHTSWSAQTEPTAARLQQAESYFAEQELWTYDVERLKTQRKVVTRPKKVLRGVGLNFGKTFNSYRTAEPMELMPSSLGFIGYEGFRQVHPNWMLNFTLDIGIRRPSPGDAFQTQIMEQIDFAALLNGDDIEVDLDVVIGGHFTGAAGIGLDYLFPTIKRTQTYAGLGLRFFGGAFISGRIDTTIVIEGGGGFGSFGDLGGFSGDRDDIDFRDGSGDFSNSTQYFFTLSPKLGFFHKLTDRWVFDMNAQYNLDPAQVKNEADHFSYLQFNLGLKYRFIGRVKTSYEYLKVMARP